MKNQKEETEMNKKEEILSDYFLFTESVNLGLAFDATKRNFYTARGTKVLPYDQVMKYLKGFFGNKARFKSRLLDIILEKAEKQNPGNLKEIPQSLIDIYDNFDNYEQFTYKEAFEIEDEAFRRIVFDTVNIPQMISELGSRRVAVKGHHFRDKVFSDQGDIAGYKEYDSIYEIHEVDATKLGLEGQVVYFMKVWCTSTNKEHWISILEDHKDNPLEAIASTFHIHRKAIPYIKEFKRQGDVFFVELLEKVPFEEKDENDVVPITAAMYFKYLTSQT